MQTITLIAAVADNGCIGSGNAMPWHIAEDFAFFKRYTLGKPVVMGRKTWDSLPKKPLPGRRNIVITRQGGWQAEGAERAASLADALAMLADAPEIIIMGGAQIYTQALPLATDLRLTEVRLTIDGDAFFPALNAADWQEAERSSHTAAANGIRFDFAHYRRVPQAT
ncbi:MULTISPECIES: dihydrofolate reductase [Eikenella]|uniref:Dihydrofolate reductase n=1 Tax=Eikenella longinqua TaxID=1795827 RepID=A0A1A9RUX1_9NEIS|nr:MULTISPECIES: dihydrofolate reductase [Eikenella]OAM26849.1 dihydrofolate reductase [Eikenella longinqua]